MAQTAVRLVRQDRPKEPLRFTFTKGDLAAIKSQAGQKWAYDAKVDGLAMLTLPSGVKTFYLCKRIDGRYRRVKIGPFPETSIENARKQAVKLHNEIVSGSNPADARKQARAAMTFAEMFALYMEAHAKPHKRTADDDKKQYNRHLKHWSGRRLNQITRQDVHRLHGKIGKDAPYAANRMLALLSKIFVVAADMGFTGDNPCKGVKRFREEQRERFMDESELPRWLEAVEAEPDIRLRHYMKLLLFTGQRRENVASMRWDELDLRRKVWTIPGDKFKTGSAVEIPLAAPALAILHERKLENDDRDEPSEWVFPSHRREAKTPYLCEPKSAFERACAKAEITGLRLHDIRRTVASWATMQGVPYPVVARMVGHKVQGVTGIYARFDLSAVRDGFERTVNAMLAAKVEGGE